MLNDERIARIEEIRSRLNAIPEYDSGNANARVCAKLACRVMSEIGLKIPGWTIVRTIIGKGSAQYLLDGIADYDRELSAMLTRMGGGEIKGIPDNLAPMLMGLWQESLRAAYSQYTSELAHWKFSAESAEANSVSAKHALAETNSKFEALNQELDQAKSKIAELQHELELERTTRERIERLVKVGALKLNKNRRDRKSVTPAVKKQTL